MNQVVVTIDVSAEVRDHWYGSWSLRTPADNGVTVYLDGTPDELRQFASRLFDAADAHDKASA